MAAVKAAPPQVVAPIGYSVTRNVGICTSPDPLTYVVFAGSGSSMRTGLSVVDPLLVRVRV